MTYLIHKKVGNFHYWYNQKRDRWEGLVNNATVFVYKYPELLAQLKSRFGPDISYIKK